MASEPSATTTTRQPNRISSVSMIFAVMGLSSASRHVNARSLGSTGRRRSSDPEVDDGGVVSSGICVNEPGQASESEPSSVVETDAVRSRLGIEFRRIPSMSRWFCLKRSTAPNSEGFRECERLCA